MSNSNEVVCGEFKLSQGGKRPVEVVLAPVWFVSTIDMIRMYSLN